MYVSAEHVFVDFSETPHCFSFVGGSKLGVQSKRTYLSRKSNTEIKKFTLKEIVVKKKLTHPVEEKNYVLRPDVTPPARQMFYQVTMSKKSMCLIIYLFFFF